RRSPARRRRSRRGRAADPRGRPLHGEALAKQSLCRRTAPTTSAVPPKPPFSRRSRQGCGSSTAPRRPGRPCAMPARSGLGGRSPCRRRPLQRAAEVRAPRPARSPRRRPRPGRRRAGGRAPPGAQPMSLTSGSLPWGKPCFPHVPPSLLRTPCLRQGEPAGKPPGFPEPFHHRTGAEGSRLRPCFDVLGFEQAPDRLRGLGALREPVLDLLLVELDRRRVGLRVIAPDDLDELAVTR